MCFGTMLSISDVAVSLFGATYTGLLMSSAMVIRVALPEYWGGVLLLGIFCSIWANDAFAYLNWVCYWQT